MKYNGSVLTFYYEKTEVPTATIKYQVIGEGAPRYTTTINVTGTGYDTEVKRGDYGINSTLESSGYTYKGYVREDNSGRWPTSGYQNASSCHLKDNGSVLTFYYEKQPNATVVTIKCREENGTTEGAKIPGYEDQTETITSAQTYTAPTIAGYDYTGLEVIQPTKISKTTDTSIRIQVDEQTHEIIFWYKKQIKSGVVVKYVSKNTGKLIGESAIVYLSKGESKSFSQEQVKAYSTCYTYANETKVDNVVVSNQPIVPITGDEKNHEIIFYYVQNVKIKIHTVCEYPYAHNESGPNTLEIPVTNKKYSAPDWDGYEFLNQYTVDYTTLVYNGQEPQSSGSLASVNVKEEADITKNPVTQVSVIFYYKSENVLTIKHVDERTNLLMPDTSILTVPIVPGQKIEDIKSYPVQANGYINSKVTLDGTDITPSGVSNTRDRYSVTVEYNGDNRELIFYYKKQQLIVKHEYVDGTPIKNPEYVDIPTTQSKLPDYPYVGNKLNGVPGTESTVSVDINPDIPGNQELVFLYVTPALIFGETDPNPDPHYPDGDDYDNIREHLGVGVIPDDLNNQYVGQKDKAYYWVLDEKGGLTYRFAMLHIDSASVSVESKASIPFDVYIGGVLKKKDTEIGMTYKKVGSKNGYDIYEGKIENIYVPIWVDEAEYEITVSVRATTVLNGVTSQSNWGIEHAKVTVVGRIYDFSVTNLQGDDIWKTSLFTTYKTDNGEHEADTLPIGQNTNTSKLQQNPKYLYGIKQGSKVFFSVNTKGSANTGIKILPKFYYIDKAGNWIGEVKAYSKNQEITAIDLVRSSAANDSYRVTQEYKNELVTARSVYSGVKYDKSGIGSYAKILLGAENRTPYLGYWTNTATQDSESLIAKFGSALTMDQISSNTGISKIELYKEANHWYGDYMLPSDTKYYKDGTQLAQDGFVVVYFSIVSTRGNDDYLAYNKSSGKETKTQWQVEQNGNNSYNIPKTLTNQTGKTITSWLQPANPAYMGAAPVMIYQISQSTSQNYDTVGTH